MITDRGLGRARRARLRRGLVLAVLVMALGVLQVPSVDGPGQAAASTPRASDDAPHKVRKQFKVSIKVRPEVLTEQRSSKRTVALTFDDGPDPAWTPQVLALLRRHHAVATFCMVGENVRAHPDLVDAVIDAGMRLCDHTRTHPANLTLLDATAEHAEIVGGRSDLAAATKAAVVYFRAPGGNWSPELVSYVAGKRMQPLGWSVDPRDWSLPGTPSIVRTVQTGVHPGAIILMHDGGGDRSQTVAALRTLLPWLDEQGYDYGFPTS